MKKFQIELKLSLLGLLVVLFSQSIMAQLNPSDYEYNMSLTSRLFVDGVLVSEENEYQIVVKDSTAIVGMSHYDVAIPNAGMFSFMTIYAHHYTDDYKVYIIDLEENEVLVDSAFTFVANQVMGGVLSPITHVLGDVIIGCTDESYLEYNPEAEADDGSCETLAVFGCTDSLAFNYNALANMDDGSCIEDIGGCTDENACNYNPDATTDDGSCIIIFTSVQEYTWDNPYVTVFTDAENPIYEWFYQGDILDETGSSLSPNWNGDYHVLIIDASGCSTSVDFSVTTLNTHKMDQIKYSIYPNPSEDFIVLEKPKTHGDLRIELLNLYGQVVLKQDVGADSMQIYIDVKHLAAASYFLSLDYGDKRDILKWIKK